MGVPGVPRAGQRRRCGGLCAALVIIASTALACAAVPPTEERRPAGGEVRRMAITVDDLPAAPPNRHTTVQQEEITDRLLAVLAAHDAPAIGFVNESRLEVNGEIDPRRVALLERWLDAGHQLGNHGHGHLDLHRVEAEVWMADVLRGERVTRPLVEGRGGQLRWFRHPFLHTGRSREIQQRTARFLADHGYRIAPVTVDNGEWIYADAYAHAWNRRDEATMERLGRDYVRYMLEVVEFYEGQSRAIVGELIPQSLLIHAYALNADWLDPLLDALEERGYRWISLDEAAEHAAFDRPTDGYTGPGGITWLHRWAISEGVDPTVFAGEPEVPGWVRELRNQGVDARTAPPDPRTAPPDARPLVVERAERPELFGHVAGLSPALTGPLSFWQPYLTGGTTFPPPSRSG